MCMVGGTGHGAATWTLKGLCFPCHTVYIGAAVGHVRMDEEFCVSDHGSLSSRNPHRSTMTFTV